LPGHDGPRLDSRVVAGTRESTPGPTCPRLDMSVLRWTRVSRAGPTSAARDAMVARGLHAHTPFTGHTHATRANDRPVICGPPRVWRARGARVAGPCPRSAITRFPIDGDATGSPARRRRNASAQLRGRARADASGERRIRS
jgi:hypothetical protein